jgi:hypothetical protein
LANFYRRKTLDKSTDTSHSAGQQTNLLPSFLLLDRPVGYLRPNEADVCFYIGGQIVRVKDAVAEKFKKQGYPKADYTCTPDQIEQE